MKYHKIEDESFKELLKNREDVKKNFVRQEKALKDKKEKLFKNKDLSKWGYEGDIKDVEKVHERLL